MLAIMLASSFLSSQSNSINLPLRSVTTTNPMSCCSASLHSYPSAPRSVLRARSAVWELYKQKIKKYFPSVVAYYSKHGMACGCTVLGIKMLHTIMAMAWLMDRATAEGCCPTSALLLPYVYQWTAETC